MIGQRQQQTAAAVIKRTSIAAMLVLLAACQSVSDVRKQIEGRGPVARATFDGPSIPIQQRSRVSVASEPILPATRFTLIKKSSEWLREKKVEPLYTPRPMPISNFIASLAANGINVISDLPLDRYTFAGSLAATDAETALKVVLGAARLDFVVDETRKVVIVKPLPTKTWVLPIINRSNSFSTGSAQSGQAGQSAAGATNGNYGSQNGQNSQGSQQNGQADQGNNGQQSNNGNQSLANAAGGAAGGGGIAISNDDNFWNQLDLDIGRRLSVLMPPMNVTATSGQLANGQSGAVFPTQIPGMRLPGMNQEPAQPVFGAQIPPDQAGQNGKVNLTTIGTKSINPTTGTIWVQAPSWVLEELDAHMRTVREMYLAELAFEGQLVMVNETRGSTEAFDLQNRFARWANGRYSALISNSSLGGVSVSFKEGNIPSLSAGNQSISGPLIGIRSIADGLELFNNYMQSLGNFNVMERLKLSTNSGVPSSVTTMAPREYQWVEQALGTGNVGATQQVTNYTIKQKMFGTTLRVSPKYDFATGDVKALVDIENLIYAGEKIFPQKFSIGNQLVSIDNSVPQGKRMAYIGEATFRNNQLVILGGQSIETMQSDESGLPGGSVPLGGIFGSKQASTTKGVYYFILHVTIRKGRNG